MTNKPPYKQNICTGIDEQKVLLSHTPYAWRFYVSLVERHTIRG